MAPFTLGFPGHLDGTTFGAKGAPCGSHAGLLSTEWLASFRWLGCESLLTQPWVNLLALSPARQSLELGTLGFPASSSGLSILSYLFRILSSLLSYLFRIWSLDSESTFYSLNNEPRCLLL